MPSLPSPWTAETLAAYLAAFVDTDGSIGYSRYGPRTYVLRVSLYNNNPAPLRFLQERFGGSLHSRESHARRFAKRTQYTLVWHAKAADVVLPLIAPYMIAKRDQALLALEIRQQVAADGFNGHADKSWQAERYQQMKALNARYRGEAA